jgi:hypothetical protein
MIGIAQTQPVSSVTNCRFSPIIGKASPCRYVIGIVLTGNPTVLRASQGNRSMPLNKLNPLVQKSTNVGLS